jgi:4-amino-4-deoxy-L-arabinose transferase-like glycosyltransferase
LKINQWEKTLSVPLIAVFFLVGFLLLIAILQPPNNWDGMTYHMSRVMHWIQNQNINYYASNIDRQILLNPFAEYGILHTVVLTDSDYFANSIQWIAMMGILATVSLITQWLGGSLLAQILTSLLTLSAPIILLESFSTQNDLVASFFVLMAIYGIIELKKNMSFVWALWIGGAIGFALFTKSTSYFFLLPWVLYVLWLFYKNYTKKFLYVGVIISFLVIVINIPFYAKNIYYFQTLIPRTGTLSTVTNEKFSISLFGGNFIKTIGYNLTLNNTNYNRLLENCIYGSHRLMNINPNDKRVNFGGFEMPYGNKFYSQDYAPNPLHTWCFLILLPIIYIFREKFSKEFFLTFGLLCSAFLFLMFMLKWQPFGTRFQVTFWAMVSVWMMVVMDKIFVKSKKITTYVLFIMTLGLSWLNIHYLLNATNVSLTGKETIFNTEREKVYFALRYNLYDSYKKLVGQIQESKCEKISIKIGLDDWEYGLWVLLRNRGMKPIIKHQNIDKKGELVDKKIENATIILEDKTFEPCAKIFISNEKNIAILEK